MNRESHKTDWEKLAPFLPRAGGLTMAELQEATKALWGDVDQPSEKLSVAEAMGMVRKLDTPAE